MSAKHPFEVFLLSFIPAVSAKSRQMGKALWILETTGSSDAADLKAELDTELRMLFNDKKAYENLLAWDQDPLLKDPILKRQLNVLIRNFKHNLIPKALLEEISKKEAELLYTYANFKLKFEGKPLSENGIRKILKENNDPIYRQKTWEASKEIGEVLAPTILNLIKLRNEAAVSLGYSDYFQMQLDLQEVDSSKLFHLLDEIASHTEEAYSKLIDEIESHQCQRFNVTKEDLGPWAYSEPFGQEDPIEALSLDSLTRNLDISDFGRKFYEKMGIDILPVLNRSDMFERSGKNQHAFCINIDRDSSDIRTLNNVKPTIKWLETVLHELGHATYELGFDPKLPWLLKEPPHMITTEAMALIAGRRAYLKEGLTNIKTSREDLDLLVQKAEESLKRRQLIFSRFVLVMTHFEKELYRNVDQDLNALWWTVVHKYQKIRIPKNREEKTDWATKYHIGLAPVYYYSYLLGEIFASEIEETLFKETGAKDIFTETAGKFLQERLFFPGNSMHWADLIKNVTGHSLNSAAWIHQFASNQSKE